MGSYNDLDKNAAALNSKLDWADTSGRDHFVQFYTQEAQIIDAVAAYFVHGLRFGEACIIAATPEHNTAILKRMREISPEVDSALIDESFIVLDAHETLAKFMVNGWPQKDTFEDVIGGLITKAVERKKRVRVFGEMVAVLTADGKPEAAVELELLWNGLATRLHFRLFCAYPDHSLTHPETIPHASAICSSHSHVFGREALAGMI